eukprot:CAMPEP_0176256144 /NCGR_PEP_ID=MMETSP0121_2-20121125/37394_1 /TAXON_ID=160619 /ORGANISM="Kryptoperidinium foliaceum, Strain CCMP 1326" /LENGTH=269 /DNA_ID=CAMNT_0017595971 /DNA_START=1 /DNA_END=810 /DNA_ORIENTATION=+
MKQTGLDMELATKVTMRDYERGDTQPEDLSPGEVAHLCVMLLSDPDLPDWQARVELRKIQEVCRAEVEGQQAHHLVCGEAGAFKLRRCKRWCELLSSLMMVDLDYIITSLIWHRQGQFEVPESLVVELMKLCMNDDAAKEWARTVSEGGLSVEAANRSLLTKSFGLNEWTRIAHRAGIIDASSQKGLPYGALQSLFQRTHREIVKLMEARAAALKWRSGQEFTRDDTGLIGRNELGILLQTFWQTLPFKALYPSPLHMTVRFVAAAASA